MTTTTEHEAPAPRTEPDARPVPATPALWFSVLALVLAAVIPGILIVSTPLSMRSSDAWIWALWVMVLAGLRLAWLVAQGAPRLFEMVFWVFSYLFVGVAPVSQFRAGVYPGTTPNIDTSLNGPAMLVVWVGLAAFVVGVAVATIRKPFPAQRLSVPLVVPHRLYVALVLITAWVLYYVAKIGPGSLVATRQTRGSHESAAWPVSTITAIVIAVAALAPVIGFAAVMRLRRQRKAAGRPAPVWWAVLMAVLVLAVDNPISMARYISGTAILSMVVALGATLRPRGYRWLAVGLLVGFVFVFPLADLFRYNSTSGQEKPTSFAETFQSPDFDAINQINNTLAYVRDNGVTKGKQVSGAVLFFVPRNVWPGKADDTGVLLADYRGYTVTNLSAPVWTELFIDGGWWWMAAGMGALGYALRRLDSQAIARMEVFHAPGLLAGTLPFYLVIMLRGSLLQSMAGFTVLSLTALAVSRRVPASRVAAVLAGGDGDPTRTPAEPVTRT